MAEEIKFTVENLNSLTQAIAEGVSTVKYSDKTIEYRSLEEMIQLRNLMKKELGLDKTKGKRGLFGGKRMNAIHSKGL